MIEWHEEMLCYCGLGGDGSDPLGHTPSEYGCVSGVKKGVYPSLRWGGVRPTEVGSVVGNALYSPPLLYGQLKPKGTCPECGKSVGVQRIRVFANRTRRGELLEPVINPREERGYPLEIRPGMVPHKVGGVECAGTGQVPAETRYTPGRELASYLHVLTEESEAS